jgi:hypothetical protein
MTKDKVLEVQNLPDLLSFVPPVHHDLYNSLPHQTAEGHRRQEAAQECVPEDFELDHVPESDSD